MNKNTPVVQLQIDDDTAAIVKVTKALELAYLPIGIDYKTGIPNNKAGELKCKKTSQFTGF
jgi:hypothetical protein